MSTIGIDLGTTNSLVAHWTDNGPEIIPNVLGENLTPSVVSIDENGDILVGQIAKERLITHPLVTVSTFKRYMGTEKMYHLGKYSFTPEELSSFVIKTLKEDAEAYLEKEITEAVISVPAYFNDAQRKATKRAAEIAGLKVERLISEPTAAAIAYGLHQQESETKFLIFDLGGGTFDVSILELFEGIMEVKSIAGDNFLGGEDFTNLLVSYFVDQHNIDIHSVDNKAHSAIYKQAELCKRALGRENTGTMTFTYEGQTYETKIGRTDFEKIVNPLLLRLRHPIERALRDASLSPDELDAVILIGGTTKMPIIRTVVGKIFGRMPYVNINPDEAVGLGAAIQVALKERNAALDEIILTDVCPYTLGTDIVKRMANGKFEDGYYLPIIERNTPIPVSKVERLFTVVDNQSELRVEIYQGESRRTEANLKLGELNVKVKPAPAGEQAIDVRYTYDINGILEVEVVNVESGKKERIVVEKNSGRVSKEEIEERLEALKNIKIHPRERTENRLLLARAERLYEESLNVKRTVIEHHIFEFESVLARQNEWEIKKAAEKLSKELEKLERWLEF
ncbi:molecular chaperone HscC [Bacillus suaedaesalsae]|uniref:Chaperone protein DnaK n=1 Tax=Bacillus suaedaesalsae TaxID=2810349 RepID=A0ABS2DF09_9BACI|nr:molecular chaperone HscC [Bacillus suaedaesalsae]MBM6616605.1 Hsp70 family protein [Bacillus suaedaesalsae]